MATADEVIRLSRLRSAIGGVGDSEDALLTTYRNSAIRWVENWTCRKIVDVDGWQTEAEDFSPIECPDILAFKVSDVRSTNDAGDTVNIVLHYRNADDDPIARPNQTLTIASNEDRILIDRDAVYIYYTGDDSWGRTMRFAHPVPYIVCNRGMDVDDIPPPFIDAIALMVRGLYDGSVYDNVSAESVMSMLLSPYKLEAGMRSTR